MATRAISKLAKNHMLSSTIEKSKHFDPYKHDNFFFFFLGLSVQIIRSASSDFLKLCKSEMGQLAVQDGGRQVFL